MLATAGLQISQPSPWPCFASNAPKSAHALDAHDVIQLLARIREVLAHVVVDREALLLHLGLHHLRDERHAAAARRAGLGRASSVRRCSVAPAHTAAHMSPFETLLHEQICAAAGSASTPRPGLALPSA